MKAKEALFKAGRIQSMGRGRISADNHAWLKTQADNGVKFSDWPKGKVVVLEATPDAKEEVRVVRSAADSSIKTVAELTPILFPEDEFKAVESRNGKRVVRSMREACRNCRVSLVICHCGSPEIVAHDGSGSVRVTIERL